MYEVVFNGGGRDTFGTMAEVMECLTSLDVDDCAEVYGAARLFMFGWVQGSKVSFAPVQCEIVN